MTTGELLLTLLIALLVFGPDRLPALARHLGKFVAIANRYKQQATSNKQQAFQLWEDQKKELLLQENIKKAAQVDKQYDE